MLRDTASQDKPVVCVPVHWKAARTTAAQITNTSTKQTTITPTTTTPPPTTPTTSTPTTTTQTTTTPTTAYQICKIRRKPYLYRLLYCIHPSLDFFGYHSTHM